MIESRTKSDLETLTGRGFAVYKGQSRECGDRTRRSTGSPYRFFDDAMRERLVEKGFCQVKKFSWKLAAKQVIEAYERTTGNGDASYAN